MKLLPLSLLSLTCALSSLFCPLTVSAQVDSVTIRKPIQISFSGFNDFMKRKREEPVTDLEGRITIVQHGDTLVNNEFISEEGRVETNVEVTGPAWITGLDKVFVPDKNKLIVPNNGRTRDVNAFLTAKDDANLLDRVDAEVYTITGQFVDRVPLVNLHNGTYQLYYDFGLQAHQGIYLISIPPLQKAFKYLVGRDFSGRLDLSPALMEHLGTIYEQDAVKTQSKSSARTALEEDPNTITISYTPLDDKLAFAKTEEVSLDPRASSLEFSIILKHYIERTIGINSHGRTPPIVKLALVKREGTDYEGDVITGNFGEGIPPYAKPKNNIILPDGSVYKGQFNVNMVDPDPDYFPVGARPFEDGEKVIDTDVFNEDPYVFTLSLPSRDRYNVNVTLWASTTDNRTVRFPIIRLFNDSIEANITTDAIHFKKRLQFPYREAGEGRKHWLPADTLKVPYNLYISPITSADGVYYGLPMGVIKFLQSGNLAIPWNDEKAKRVSPGAIDFADTLEIRNVITPEDYINSQ